MPQTAVQHMHVYIRIYTPAYIQQMQCAHAREPMQACARQNKHHEAWLMLEGEQNINRSQLSGDFNQTTIRKNATCLPTTMEVQIRERAFERTLNTAQPPEVTTFLAVLSLADAGLGQHDARCAVETRLLSALLKAFNF